MNTFYPNPKPCKQKTLKPQTPSFRFRLRVQQVAEILASPSQHRDLFHKQTRAEGSLKEVGSGFRV